MSRFTIRELAIIAIALDEEENKKKKHSPYPFFYFFLFLFLNQEMKLLYEWQPMKAYSGTQTWGEVWMKEEEEWRAVSYGVKNRKIGYGDP